jgi:hypothetical protein
MHIVTQETASAFSLFKHLINLRGCLTTVKIQLVRILRLLIRRFTELQRSYVPQRHLKFKRISFTVTFTTLIYNKPLILTSCILHYNV